MLKVIPWNKDLEKSALEFLEHHQETALFLLSNLVQIGPYLTDHIYSGNYQLVVNDDLIVAVFCLTKSGNILLQTDRKADYSEIILETCLHESSSIEGVIGEWSAAKSLWDLVRSRSSSLTLLHETKEILFQLNVDKIQIITPSTLRSSFAFRFLQLKDFDTWKKFRKDYLETLSLPLENLNIQHKLFIEAVHKKYWWGLFINDELISIAAYNAVYKKLAQIGGVCTRTDMRRKGFSTHLMKQLVQDSKSIHHLKTLILFTDEDNYAAQKVYEKVGFERIGAFGLFFANIQ